MVKNLDLKDNDAVAEFQKLMGLEADGIAGKDTISVIRALQSGEHEKATSGYRPDMQIIGRQQGGYSLEGGGDVPGNDTGDKNPAMLEDGEYVLNRNAVKALGKGFLDHINDERYPRFQSGGFQEPDIAGGTAQLVQPPVMDNSEAFSFGGGGGGEEGGGGMDMGMLMKLAPMLMGAPPMQRGGHIPGYQFGGGFSAPGGGGARAQIIRPPVMDNSGAFDFGGGDNLGGAPQGGNDPVITQTTTPEGGQTTGDFSNVDMDWQSGGHVPKYQQGGTVRRPTGYQMGGYRPSTRTGMITNEELEQSQRNEDWKSDVRRMGAGYNYDVNKYQKDIDETYKDAGISHWNPLNLIPGVWDKEQYQEEAQRHKDEYAREHMEEAFDPSKVPSNVRMDQEGYQLLQEHGGVPEQSKDARLSSDALKKRWWESMNPEGYDASEWIEQWFGNQTN